MWFLWDLATRGVIKLTQTLRGANNYRYIQQQPRVALSIADPNDQYRYRRFRA